MMHKRELVWWCNHEDMTKHKACFGPVTWWIINSNTKRQNMCLSSCFTFQWFHGISQILSHQTGLLVHRMQNNGAITLYQEMIVTY